MSMILQLKVGHPCRAGLDVFVDPSQILTASNASLTMKWHFSMCLTLLDKRNTQRCESSICEQEKAFYWFTPSHQDNHLKKSKPSNNRSCESRIRTISQLLLWATNVTWRGNDRSLGKACIVLTSNSNIH
jgi:hypothetical protein